MERFICVVASGLGPLNAVAVDDAKRADARRNFMYMVNKRRVRRLLCSFKSFFEFVGGKQLWSHILLQCVSVKRSGTAGLSANNLLEFLQKIFREQKSTKFK